MSIEQELGLALGSEALLRVLQEYEMPSPRASGSDGGNNLTARNDNAIIRLIKYFPSD